MVIVLTGVCGAGKTTIGRLLARKLSARFYEGDAYHSRDAIDKMASNIPLTDNDRQPWLAALQQLIRMHSRRGDTVIVACSAWKQSYRDFLCQASRDVRFVFLRGEYDLISKRLNQRKGHFATKDLLASQFAILEEPAACLVVDVAASPREIVEIIRRRLRISADNNQPTAPEAQ
jgi:gluconokinase